MPVKSSTKQKFATQVEQELLDQIREVANSEGRKLQSIVEEAFRDLLVKRQNGAIRSSVAEAFANSVREFGPLYEKLAK